MHFHCVHLCFAFSMRQDSFEQDRMGMGGGLGMMRLHIVAGQDMNMLCAF